VKIWAIILGIALAFIFVFLALAGQGAPSGVTSTISATPTPYAAQTLQVTMTFSFYSFQTPNTIFLPGSAIVYSVYENKVVLANNQTISPNPVSQSGSVFTESATILITTTALCSASANCTRIVQNITVVSTPQVKTYPAILFGPTTSTTFSNIYATTTSPTPAAPSPLAFYGELFGFAFAAIGVAGVCGYIAIPHKAILIVGLVGIAGAVGFLLLLV
jgi:hypothetical protein